MRPRDRGAATVVVVSVIASVLTATVAGIMLAGALVASQRARLAADLGALAGAVRLQEAAPVTAACAEARRVVRANRARLQGCSAEGLVLEVSVSVRASTWPGEALARARAGPDPERAPGSR